MDSVQLIITKPGAKSRAQQQPTGLARWPGVLLLFVCFVFSLADSVSLCSPDYPQSHSTAQGGPELRDLPASGSGKTGVHYYTMAEALTPSIDKEGCAGNW